MRGWERPLFVAVRDISVRLHLAGAVLHSGRVELEPVGSGCGPARH